MYVYIYIYMYIYIYIYYVYIHIYLYIYIYIYIYIQATWPVSRPDTANIKGWNSHVHRKFPGKLESSDLSRETLSREMGRMPDIHGPMHTFIYIYIYICDNKNDSNNNSIMVIIRIVI